MSKYIIQQTCDWIVKIYYATDSCSFIFTTNLRQTYNKLTTDLWLNCRNILCNRPVFVYFYNRLTTNLQQTCDWIVEIYCALDSWSFIFTTNLQQTYDRPVIELSKYIMTDLRQLWIFKLFIFRFKAWLKILRHSL